MCAPTPPAAEADAELGLADVWSMLYKLRAECEGPDGHATWKEAAIAERLKCAQLQAERGAAVRDAERMDHLCAIGRVEWRDLLHAQQIGHLREAIDAAIAAKAQA